MLRAVTGRPGRLRGIIYALAFVSMALGADGDAAATATELRQLRTLLMQQQREIDELRRTLEEQTTVSDAGIQPAAPAFPKLGEVGSATPLIPAGPAMPPMATAMPLPQKIAESSTESTPLQFRIGSTYFTPMGFRDFTGVFRDTAPGSNIGTNFGSFPYRAPSSVPGNLSEFRLSPQNSRIGARLDTRVKGTKVMAYWESDFLGGINNPPVGNLAVSTNSYPLRLRLFWVDVKKEKWEVLAGQTWSLLTPTATAFRRSRPTSSLTRMWT